MSVDGKAGFSQTVEANGNAISTRAAPFLMRLFKRKKQKPGMPWLLFDESLNGLLAAVILNGCRMVRTIYQLNESHRCIIALTETHFQNPEVTTISCRITWAKFCEQLDHDLAIAQTIERKALVSQCVCFTQSQDRLYNTTQLFCLGQRGLNRFMTKQRDRHVAQHGKTM